MSRSVTPPHLHAVAADSGAKPSARDGWTDAGPLKRNGWLGVELRHLVALQAVAHARSFRGAAEELGYVQSAVSQQIAFLERMLGARLVERSRGRQPVRLTPAGTLVVGQVEELTAHLRAARAEMEAIAQGRSGMLRVGVFNHVGARLMPEVLRRFARRWPQIEINAVGAGSDAELVHLVNVGKLDVAFAVLPLPGGDFEWEELMFEEHVLLVPATSPLAAAGSIRRLDDLARLELVQNRGCRHAARAEAQLRARGLRPTIVREAHSAAAVQALVGANVGLAVMPRTAVDPDDQCTAIVHIGDLVSPRTLVLAWCARRPRGTPFDDFARFVRKVIADQGKT